MAKLYCPGAKIWDAIMETFKAAAEHCFDAILMDIRMPVMNGLEAAKAIRALPRADARRVPIIAMTANVFDDEIRQTLNAGMDAHIPKPIDPTLLRDTLCKLLFK